MIVRLIIRYLTNHPELVERLSNSYPMRRAARFAVYIFNRSKLIAEERGLQEKLSPEKLKQFTRRFSNNLREELEKARQEYLKKGKS